jgi:hypothetical protein
MKDFQRERRFENDEHAVLKGENNRKTDNVLLRTLRTILHNWVASNSCWRLEIRGSITKCLRISAIQDMSG